MAVTTLPKIYDADKIINLAGGTPNDYTIDTINNAITCPSATQDDLEMAIHIVALGNQYKSEIDNFAGELRSKYISTIPGQAEVYQEKYDQAVDHAANAYPADLTDYPLIQAEVDATSLTAQQATDAILAARTNWLTSMAAIETERRKGKVNIDAATDLASIESAFNVALAALQAL